MQHAARLTPALLVVALLVATPALPQARRGAAPPPTISFAETLRSFVPGFLLRFWDAATPAGDSGCGVDPYGGHCTATRPPVATVSGDSGCIADPYGRCASARLPVATVTGDSGCIFDPYGRCTSAAQAPTTSSH